MRSGTSSTCTRISSTEAATVVDGWHGRAYADQVIAEGRAAFLALKQT